MVDFSDQPIVRIQQSIRKIYELLLKDLPSAVTGLPAKLPAARHAVICLTMFFPFPEIVVKEWRHAVNVYMGLAPYDSSAAVKLALLYTLVDLFIHTIQAEGPPRAMGIAHEFIREIVLTTSSISSRRLDQIIECPTLPEESYVRAVLSFHVASAAQMPYISEPEPPTLRELEHRDPIEDARAVTTLPDHSRYPSLREAAVAGGKFPARGPTVSKSSAGASDTRMSNAPTASQPGEKRPRHEHDDEDIRGEVIRSPEALKSATVGLKDVVGKVCGTYSALREAENSFFTYVESLPPRQHGDPLAPEVVAQLRQLHQRVMRASEDVLGSCAAARGSFDTISETLPPPLDASKINAM